MADEVRLIDANALEKDFTDWYDRARPYDKELIEIAILSVEDAPTIEAQPVKHGWWLDNPIQSQLYSYICSNCRNSCDWTYRYCPCCGAKMDLKEI